MRVSYDKHRLCRIVTFTASCFPLPKEVPATRTHTHTHTDTDKEGESESESELTAKKRSILCGALVRVSLLADTAAYIIDVYGYPTTHRYTQKHTHSHTHSASVLTRSNSCYNFRRNFLYSRWMISFPPPAQLSTPTLHILPACLPMLKMLAVRRQLLLAIKSTTLPGSMFLKCFYCTAPHRSAHTRNLQDISEIVWDPLIKVDIEHRTDGKELGRLDGVAHIAILIGIPEKVCHLVESLH